MVDPLLKLVTENISVAGFYNMNFLGYFYVLNYVIQLNSNLDYIKNMAMKKIKNIPEKCSLIDVLSDSSFARKHIKGAKNISVYEIAFLDKMNKEYPDKSQPLCIYGWSDRTQEVKRAYEFLTKAGYSDISTLSGGLEAWEEDGRPIERGEVIRKLDGNYAIDSNMSIVEWSGRNIGKRHIGRILVKDGKFIFKEGNLKGGEIILDMNSISNIDLDDVYKNQLINHLKSDDFFSVDKFSEAKLKISEINKLEVESIPNYYFKAMLTIKDITKEIEFEASVHEKENKMVLNAHFDIDRTKWNVKYGSERFFSKLGIHIVDDVISFDIILFGDRI